MTKNDEPQSNNQYLRSLPDLVHKYYVLFSVDLKIRLCEEQIPVILRIFLWMAQWHIMNEMDEIEIFFWYVCDEPVYLEQINQ